MEADRIGIPPVLMRRDKGERIPIEHWGDGLIVFNKPQSIAAIADPWYLNYPDLESCFNTQIAQEKPELIKHGVTSLAVCNQLEPEVTGAVLASISENSKEHWRNLYGSSRFVFHFFLIARKNHALPEVVDCDLPMARHFKNEMMMVSHNLGKKAATRFTLLETGRDAQAWLASTRYPRLHQLRLHSREKGICLLNDPRYDPNYAPEARGADLHKLDWIHCYAIQASEELGTKSPLAIAEPPKYWKRYLRKTGLEIDDLSSIIREKIENMTLPNE